MDLALCLGLSAVGGASVVVALWLRGRSPVAATPTPSRSSTRSSAPIFQTPPFWCHPELEPCFPLPAPRLD
ncbi:hypothetical protein [Micromonospora sp. WMMD712]|uniref:hypothetical protein n=1 Tax=Micromonospora sp. WMMD712 TaxID=3016096 RepID=UPI002499DF3D|nr:hypothetical protein [Micromonospora sp. WMMD712]WFE57706.1 hypothetical protein O7633_12925 [Micromonospora sp. WMMD712]